MRRCALATVCPMLLALAACGQEAPPDALSPAPRSPITMTRPTIAPVVCHDGDGFPLYTDQVSAETLPPGWCP